MISLGGRVRPWFSEEEAKHKGKNEQGLFRQQRLDWPVPKEDSEGQTGGSGEEVQKEHGTARPEVSFGGWSGALFRLLELHVAPGMKEKDCWVARQAQKIRQMADSLPQLSKSKTYLIEIKLGEAGHAQVALILKT